MFIYNITTKVDYTILDEWLQWQKEIYIPEIIATGLFYDYRFYQLLEQDEEEGKTFVIQFFAYSKADYDQYLYEYGPDAEKKTFKKWANDVISFQTLLRDVQ